MSETPTTQPAPAMSDVPAVPPCTTPDGTPRGTRDDNGYAAGQGLAKSADVQSAQKVWDTPWDSPDQPQRQNTPESPESELVPNRRSEGVPHPHPLKGGVPFGTALPPGESAVITGDGSGWIAVCPTCSARLGVSQAGWLTCHGDGSHTWTPIQDPWARSDQVKGIFIWDGQGLLSPADPTHVHTLDGRCVRNRDDEPCEQQEHSSGSPRVMDEPKRMIRNLIAQSEYLERELAAAGRDRDAAQRLVEALWPANLVTGLPAPADPFPVIAAIVHELGRPLGEWSVQVERQSMTTDDGDVDVELVSLHRVTGRTA